MPAFREDIFLERCEEYQITETAVVPPVLLTLLASTSDAKRRHLASLRTVYCAGAPLDRSIQAKAMQLLAPDARIVQVWGMTECGWLSTFEYPERDTSGSVGRPLYGYEAK